MNSHSWSAARALLRALLCCAGIAAALCPSGNASAFAPDGTVVVGYRSPAGLRSALAGTPARLVLRMPELRAVELAPAGDPVAFAARLRSRPGIRFAELSVARSETAEPGLAVGGMPDSGAPYGGAVQWNWFAVHEDAVTDQLRQAAAQVTIAVVDTGADLSVPDLAAKTPVVTHSTWKKYTSAQDAAGHGTFVAGLAAGSPSNGEGLAGFGGEAKLMVVRAANQWGSFADTAVASGIVWAVDHGANVINLSLGGTKPSKVEKAAVSYAAAHGVLLVAATGNARRQKNPVNYPAAYLQPIGSHGVGGLGLAVGASTVDGAPAFFSSNGSWLSLLAPGENVVGPLAESVDLQYVPLVGLPGSLSGHYGFGSGSSFAAPEVTGAAALVWAANPTLTAIQVAEIIKQTASGQGTWNDAMGFGILDVAAATARAAAMPTTLPELQTTGDSQTRTTLSWHGSATSWRLTAAEDDGPAKLLLEHTATNTYRHTHRAGHSYTYTLVGLDVGGRPISSTAVTAEAP